MALLLLPVVFMAPLADEIVGKYQFDRLCEEAKKVKIYGTIPAGEELYTPEGKWRDGNTLEERNRLSKIYEALVRWDSGDPYKRETSSVIPIWQFHHKVISRRDGRLLAEWDSFATSGGWIGRHLSGEGSFFVRGKCMPDIVQRSELKLQILPFSNSQGDTK